MDKKSIILFIVLVLIGSFSSFSQGKIQALFSYGTFNSPQKGPYLETYLSVNGNSAHYRKNESGKYQAKIEITYLFKQEGKIVQFDKYNLLSPELDDSTSNKVNFLDQQRIALANGKYDLEIKIRDEFSDKSGFSAIQPIELNFDSSKMSVSSIELVARYETSPSGGKDDIFDKSGIQVIPNISDYYPDAVSSLKFYSEIYNSDQTGDEKYLIKYYISHHQSKIQIPEYTSFIRQKTAPVSIVLREFNISKLKTGNYYLVIEARNKKNELLAYNSTLFQRSNLAADTLPLDLSTVSVAQTFAEVYDNKDTLRDIVKSMRPIASDNERLFIDKHTETNADTEIETLQKFFYAFWYNRNTLNPEREWQEYAMEVRKVNESFGTSIKRGYETDRGRVYLQYGPPNTRVDIPSEPNSYPYEIWQYHKIGRQNNGRFVFYTRDLITNDYELLHSTVFGEPNYQRWDMELQRRNTPQYDLDQTNPGASTGSRAREYFNNPR